MSDQLYLSLWFPNFRFPNLPVAALSVLRQFPLSPARPGIRAAVVYPLQWSEPHVYQRIWEADEIPDDSPEALEGQLQNAIAQATEQLHEDFAYEFEVYWDLWAPAPEDAKARWQLQPSLVRLVAFGPDFGDAAFEENGQIRLDLGHDTAFLQPEVTLDPTEDPDALARVQDNIARLVELTARIEKNCGISTRLLWSEDDSNLAQKLIDRLQKLN